MNLDKLKLGQIFRNYKELCETLEIPVKTGGAKIAQFKELERHFKFTQDGHSFLIDEIYSKPLIKIDNRSLAKGQSIYIDHVSMQLLHHLASTKNVAGSNFEFMTANHLYKLTGMVNSNYLPTRQAIRDFIDENPYSLTRFDVDEFYQHTNDKMRSILRSTLNNLKNRWLIIYETRHLIKEGWKKQRISTEKDEGEIMNIKNQIAWDMGLRGERQVYLARRADEFYKKFNAEIYKQFSWSSLYSGWNITFHSSRLNENIKKYEAELKDIESNQNILNDKLAKYIIKDADRRYKKTEEKYSEYEKLIEQVWGEISKIDKNDPPFRYQDDFVKSQILLTDLFIKR